MLKKTLIASLAVLSVMQMNAQAMSQPICLITGVGDSTGSALARRFTQGGYANISI